MSLESKAAVASRLSELTRSAEGRLTPSAVVDDARDEDSPLHSHFEWDDSAAAHKHRISQAQRLIRSVKLDVIVDRRTVSVNVYVHDPADQHEAGYVEVVSLIDDRERAAETLLREFTRVAGIMQRARDIAAVLGLDVELDQMLASIDVFIARTRLLAVA